MSIDTLFLGGTSIDLIQDRGKAKLGLRFYASIGGSITNSSIISARLGLKTALLSKIGKDVLGDFAIEHLASSNVNIKGVLRDPNIYTPLAIAKIDASCVAKYAFYKNSPKDSVVPIKNVPKYLLNTCKVFHTGSSYSYQKGTFEETLKFVRYLKKRGVFISYDPNIRSYNIADNSSVKNRIFSLLKLADLAKLSEIDLEYLTGKNCPEKGLNKLKKSVNCPIVLTLGAKGSIYCHTHHYHIHPRGGQRPPLGWIWVKIPAFKIKIADTIGAGDAFIAGLIYKLIVEGRCKFFADIRSNMIFASAVSAIICTKRGANEGLNDIRQVNSFLAKNLSED